MGWFVGSSTRTPSSCISIMLVLALYEGPATERNLAGRDEMGTQRLRVRLERVRVRDLEDVGEVPIALVEIEPIADHEAVRTVESHVPGVQRHDPPDRAIEQRAELQRGGASGSQDRQEVRKGETGVDDVLD